jgi:hypothetical protein
MDGISRPSTSGFLIPPTPPPPTIPPDLRVMKQVSGPLPPIYICEGHETGRRSPPICTIYQIPPEVLRPPTPPELQLKWIGRRWSPSIFIHRGVPIQNEIEQSNVKKQNRKWLQ